MQISWMNEPHVGKNWGVYFPSDNYLEVGYDSEDIAQDWTDRYNRDGITENLGATVYYVSIHKA